MEEDRLEEFLLICRKLEEHQVYWFAERREPSMHPAAH